jgi:hypothetical protein
VEAMANESSESSLLFVTLFTLSFLASSFCLIPYAYPQNAFPFLPLKVAFKWLNWERKLELKI